MDDYFPELHEFYHADSEFALAPDCSSILARIDTSISLVKDLSESVQKLKHLSYPKLETKVPIESCNDSASAFRDLPVQPSKFSLGVEKASDVHHLDELPDHSSRSPIIFSSVLPLHEDSASGSNGESVFYTGAEFKQFDRGRADNNSLIIEFRQ